MFDEKLTELFLIEGYIFFPKVFYVSGLYERITLVCLLPAPEGNPMLLTYSPDSKQRNMFASLYLSVCLCLSVRLSVYQFIDQSLSLWIHLYTYIYINVSIHRLTYPSIDVSIQWNSEQLQTPYQNLPNAIQISYAPKPHPNPPPKTRDITLRSP